MRFLLVLIFGLGSLAVIAAPIPKIQFNPMGIPFLGVGADGISQTPGVVVTAVIGDTPASRADIQLNDVIVKVNSVPVMSLQELKNEMGKFRPGAEVEIHIKRENKDVTLKVYLNYTRAEFEKRPEASMFQPFEIPKPEDGELFYDCYSYLTPIL
jgi:C-terminal processing protease CtpA/Prc